MWHANRARSWSAKLKTVLTVWESSRVSLKDSHNTVNVAKTKENQIRLKVFFQILIIK